MKKISRLISGKKGEDTVVPYLCRIFRACIAWGYIPEIWRKATVVYLPKMGSNTDRTPKSYRPISLPSFLLKTLEKMVDRYIRDDILANNPLSDGL